MVVQTAYLHRMFRWFSDLQREDVLHTVPAGSFQQLAPVPAFEVFSFLWKHQLHQAEVFPSKHALHIPQLAAQLHQRLCLLVPLFLQRGNDQVLTTIVFGRRCKVFRGLLRIGIGVLFALGIAPGCSLRVGGGGIGFGLPSFGHVLLCLLLDLCQTAAEAVAIFVEFLLVGFPVRHRLGVTRHQGFMIEQFLAASDLRIEQPGSVLTGVARNFQAAVLLADFGQPFLLDDFVAFQ